MSRLTIGSVWFQHLHVMVIHQVTLNTNCAHFFEEDYLLLFLNECEKQTKSTTEVRP